MYFGQGRPSLWAYEAFSPCFQKTRYKKVYETIFSYHIFQKKFSSLSAKISDDHFLFFSHW